MTACPVGELLKGEVLGSKNVKHINNLIMELERTHNGGVRVGTLQTCEHGVLVSGTGCHNYVNLTQCLEIL